MKCQVEITVEQETLVVQSVYSERANQAFRRVGGKYDAARGWVIPDTETARKMLLKNYGWSEGCGTRIIRVTEDDLGGTKQLEIGGYVIATRRFRDGDVRQPTGVIMVSGTYAARGGSMRYPDVNAIKDKDGEEPAWDVVVFDGFNTGEISCCTS